MKKAMRIGGAFALRMLRKWGVLAVTLAVCGLALASGGLALAGEFDDLDPSVWYAAPASVAGLLALIGSGAAIIWGALRVLRLV